MKQKTFLILFAISALFFSSNAKASTILTSQQIEILQREVLVLRSLVENYNLQQAINSPAYIAIDLSDNSVILEKNQNKSYPIASVTKLMNATIALENINMDETITLTDEMLSPLGQTPCLFSRLKISAKNLLKATLTQSSNDAAQALSFFIGNENFLTLMNKKAKELEMEDTVYYDVYGLNSANHSTASDLAKLVSYINQNYPEIWEITKDNDFWLPNSEGTLLKFQNVNNFYYLENFIGGKTGYTTEAKQTFASVFKVGKKPVAITLLYSQNRMADIFSILRELKNKITF